MVFPGCSALVLHVVATCVLCDGDYANAHAVLSRWCLHTICVALWCTKTNPPLLVLPYNPTIFARRARSVFRAAVYYMVLSLATCKTERERESERIHSQIHRISEHKSERALQLIGSFNDTLKAWIWNFITEKLSHIIVRPSLVGATTTFGATAAPVFIFAACMLATSELESEHDAVTETRISDFYSLRHVSVVEVRRQQQRPAHRNTRSMHFFGVYVVYFCKYFFFYFTTPYNVLVRLLPLLLQLGASVARNGINIDTHTQTHQQENAKIVSAGCTQTQQAQRRRAHPPARPPAAHKSHTHANTNNAARVVAWAPV